VPLDRGGDEKSTLSSLGVTTVPLVEHDGRTRKLQGAEIAAFSADGQEFGFAQL